MKKYKLLKTLFVSTPFLVTPLVAACGDTNNLILIPDPNATDSQIKAAIINFAKVHAIDKNDININSINFQASSQKNNLETINFSFKMKSNIPDSYYVNAHSGTMIYHKDSVKFDFKTWKPQSSIPGYYQSDLVYPCTIYGNSNDYILCLSSYYFGVFLAGLKNKDDIKSLFSNSFINPNKAKDFQLSDFTAINKNNYPRITIGKFVAFHVVNQKVAWTNLPTAANSLNTSDNNDLSNVAFLNQANNKYTLFINNTVLRQLNEIYSKGKDFKTNPYLQPTYLRQHYTTQTGSDGAVIQLGFQIATSPSYTNGNASLADVVTCLLNLLKNDYAKLTEMLKKNYNAYYLTFNKTSDVWVFSSYSEFSN